MIKDLCTDLLISDRSIHKFGLFTKQIHLSEEDKAAVKLIKETTDPCSITVVEEIVNANCALPSAYIGAITTVDEPPKVIEADIVEIQERLDHCFSTFSSMVYLKSTLLCSRIANCAMKSENISER